MGTEAFRAELRQRLAQATGRGEAQLAVRAGDLHASVGGYPGPHHQMPVCCDVMRAEMVEQLGDRVLSEPPKGKGASLTICYALPRPDAPPRREPPLPGASDQVLGPDAVGRHVHPEFLAAVEALHEKFDRLSQMVPVRPGDLRGVTGLKGIYLFSEGARPMYVGRTKNLGQRIVNHCGAGARENQAVFAFKLAREATGKGKATYSREGSRALLAAEPAFATALEAAKDRVRRMDLRYVEEPDPHRQTLLEIYVAVVLKTPYNDFDTHQSGEAGRELLVTFENYRPPVAAQLGREAT